MSNTKLRNSGDKYYQCFGNSLIEKLDIKLFTFYKDMAYNYLEYEINSG
ncbi:hypothetical protein [Dapis sp. BLCC M229]